LPIALAIHWKQNSFFHSQEKASAIEHACIDDSYPVISQNCNVENKLAFELTGYHYVHTYSKKEKAGATTDDLSLPSAVSACYFGN
jgi:hypothetical protein